MKKMILLCGILVMAFLASPAYVEGTNVVADNPALLLAVLAAILFIGSKLANDYWHQLILSIAAAFLAVVAATTASATVVAAVVAYIADPVVIVVLLMIIATSIATLSLLLIATKALGPNKIEESWVFKVIFYTAMLIMAVETVIEVTALIV